ncbi:hypothetical protein H696_03693 [Fonticula alba]|uniref:Histone deacetylase domain-containing protein n=1 Tax=Fonticula alba TaxID=691883 RepID=A0A058Z556_FONAL|nr:hypothetical protein H696_03693 [Fonticula alba]KCV69266.1 hypothetical protein H696_03693 [Fonticula alba]|eukprot:XP_009495831.1 hypothetical protein H696_03693 [Fonticula alba]
MSPTARPSGFIFDERCLDHNSGLLEGDLPCPYLEPTPHMDTPATRLRVLNMLQASGLLSIPHPEMPDAPGWLRLPLRVATHREMRRAHSLAHIRHLTRLNLIGGEAGDEAPCGIGSFDVARAAAGSCIELVDAVCSGRIRNGYALVRPAGHHAERDRARGYCLLSNVAMAVRHAQAHYKFARVAVVDFDVHHGNGTQSIFYDSDAVLTVSIHQAGNYPRKSGELDERGAGPSGASYNINVPLWPGAGQTDYKTTWDRVVLPALKAYDPQLIVVSAGFDASFYDPLSRMMLGSNDYRYFTRTLVDFADASASCQGRVAVCHEGGYCDYYVPFCALAVCEELLGVRTDVRDPFLAEINSHPGQDTLFAHQASVIEQAASFVSDIVPPARDQVEVVWSEADSDEE